MKSKKERLKRSFLLLCDIEFVDKRSFLLLRDIEFVDFLSTFSV